MSFPTSDSPYAPPGSSLEVPRAAPKTEELATTGQRFVNCLVDQIATTLAGGAVGGMIVAMHGPVARGPSSWAIGLGVQLAYCALLEATSARTLGKLVTRTRVVSEDGRDARARQIVGRSFARLIPFEFFSFFGRNPVGWHDSLSRTRVIRIR